MDGLLVDQYKNYHHAEMKKTVSQSILNRKVGSLKLCPPCLQWTTARSNATWNPCAQAEHSGEIILVRRLRESSLGARFMKM